MGAYPWDEIAGVGYKRGQPCFVCIKMHHSFIVLNLSGSPKTERVTIGGSLGVIIDDRVFNWHPGLGRVGTREQE